MGHFLRPYRGTSQCLGAVLGVMIAIAPGGIHAQMSHIAQVIEAPNPFVHTAAQGYLGVLVGDVDSDSAPKLKLKETRGAVVTLIDHDAPAAQAGIRINDVLLEVNGQSVEGAEQFGRMMREISAGRKLKLLVSRDGGQQTITVQPVDPKPMEQDVWNKIDQGGSSFSSPTPSMGILSGDNGGDAPTPGGFHMPFFGSSLNVGVLVEPLTSQMADYLGIPNGLMVKQVARKSEAAASGLKAFDVILKVGAENISTMADWDRSLRANKGKPVQITILRDRKQQTITLQVDSKHHLSELEWMELDPEGEAPTMAALIQGDLSVVDMLWQQADAMRNAFHEQMQNFNLDPKQVEEMQQQMKQFRQEMEEMEARSTGQFV